MRDYLEQKALQYQNSDFIASDPISIPHRFSSLQDIEIAGLLTATIAWGNRQAILKSANIMMDLLDNAPYEFVKGASASDVSRLNSFVYRTFQQDDLPGFVRALQAIYAHADSMEHIFTPHNDETIKEGISRFRNLILPHLSPRTHKHVADVDHGAAAKRLNMFLRWMVRPSSYGVDFGLWRSIKPSQLMMPLDVHTATVSRTLGLLSRKQNDWKAVEELTSILRRFDPDDPVKYDFALFGIGVNKELKPLPRR